MTTDEFLTKEGILDALATSGNVLPRDALKQAAERWPEVGPVFLETLQAAADGVKLSERTDTILFFGIYLMAQVCEIRAFRPLCILAADHTRIDELLGDGITTDLAVILSRVYDGDQAPLRTLIESDLADQFVRSAALDALAWLTATGRIDRDETARYLRDLQTIFQPQGAHWVWVSWQQAIARLGLEELTPLVETAFERELLDPSILSLHHFQADLSAALKAVEPTEVFDETKRGDRDFDDLVAYMADWYYFKVRPEPRLDSGEAPKAALIGTTVHNPYRNVGRNDPCPCGSGKKFKKCCLDKVRSQI